MEIEVYTWEVPVTNIETQQVKKFLVMAPTLQDAADQALIEAFREFGWRRVTTMYELIERIEKAEPVKLLRTHTGLVGLIPPREIE